MKKLIVAVAVLVAFSAHAEDWRYVANNSEIELQINVESVVAAPAFKGEVWTGAFFRFIGISDKSDTRMMYMTTTKYCKEKKGIVRIKDMATNEIRDFQWVDGGTKMQDYAVRVICAFAKERKY
jgi:hypothetical protein